MNIGNFRKEVAELLERAERYFEEAARIVMDTPEGEAKERAQHELSRTTMEFVMLKGFAEEVAKLDDISVKLERCTDPGRFAHLMAERQKIISRIDENIDSVCAIFGTTKEELQ